MTENRLAEARVLAATLDKLSRNPRRFAPTAPWIIPALMIVVGLFALICLAIKLIMKYINSKNEKTKTFGMSHASSHDIPTTPEDQASMATTASMKTRGSLGLSSQRRRAKPPPVSLYQMKQKQSPGSATKAKNKAALKAMSRAAKAEANRSLSRDSTRQADNGSNDNSNNEEDNSPTNLSQRSDDTDEIQASVNQSGVLYAGAPGSDQPEVHIVQIRELEDNVQQTWPQTESEI